MISLNLSYFTNPALAIFVIYISIGSTASGLLVEVANLIPTFDFGQQLTTVKIIRGHGFRVETHEVETEDGYILELHRIPSPSAHHPQKYPVLVMHGIFQSSSDWLINYPTNASLGFFLANSGHDVWLGNHRGNTYSTKHIDPSCTLSSSCFWDFSFHEMGKYDVPAMLHYIVKTTDKAKVHYISYSMGSTAFFTALSLRPELSPLVGMGISMGPSVFQDHYLYGLARLVSWTNMFGNMFVNMFGHFPFIPHFLAQIIHKIVPLVCNPKVDLLGVCYHITHLVFGNDGGLILREQLPTITSVAPTPSSFKNWNHYLQLMGSGNFAQYDYGYRRNMEVYGGPHPLEYNLTKVQVPTAILVGFDDYLASRLDASRLGKALSRLVDFYQVPYKRFKHLDFTYGGEEALRLYHYALGLLDNYYNYERDRVLCTYTYLEVLTPKQLKRLKYFKCSCGLYIIKAKRKVTLPSAFGLVFNWD